jgi:hypothetical protein
MKSLLLAAGTLTILVCCGCTTRGMYEGVRQGQRNHCNELPATEQERCLAKNQDDFDTYNKKREEVAAKP